MLKPTYKSYWDIPGGYVEEGEAPLDACMREIREEIGLDIHVTTLLAVDWAANQGEGDKVLFVFEGGQLAEDQLASITFTDGEASEWSFVEVDRLHEVTIPRLARRIGQALEAHKAARTVYLQEGALPAVRN